MNTYNNRQAASETLNSENEPPALYLFRPYQWSCYGDEEVLQRDGDLHVTFVSVRILLRIRATLHQELLDGLAQCEPELLEVLVHRLVSLLNGLPERVEVDVIPARDLDERLQQLRFR